jgi:hypothetical protein
VNPIPEVGIQNLHRYNNIPRMNKTGEESRYADALPSVIKMHPSGNAEYAN